MATLGQTVWGVPYQSLRKRLRNCHHPVILMHPETVRHRGSPLSANVGANPDIQETAVP